MQFEELIAELSDFGTRGIQETGLVVHLIALLLSLVSSLFVSWLYVVFFKSRATGSQIHRAFPLIGISVTAIFITIQFSLPLSLGLLGALSIVRFRTPVKEPEEIAFLMVVVASGLCCSTFNALFLAILLSMVVVALLLMHVLRGVRTPSAGHGLVVVSLSDEEYRDKGGAVIEFLIRELPNGSLDSVVASPDGSSVSYRFVALAADRVAKLQDGVRAVASGAATSVFVDRANPA